MLLGWKFLWLRTNIPLNTFASSILQQSPAACNLRLAFGPLFIHRLLVQISASHNGLVLGRACPSGRHSSRTPGRAIEQGASGMIDPKDSDLGNGRDSQVTNSPDVPCTKRLPMPSTRTKPYPPRNRPRRPAAQSLMARHHPCRRQLAVRCLTAPAARKSPSRSSLNSTP